MCYERDGLADKPNPEYFVVSLQLDWLWFADFHVYCARNCDFHMLMPTNWRLTKTVVGWQNVERFALPPRDLPAVHMLV